MVAIQSGFAIAQTPDFQTISQEKQTADNEQQAEQIPPGAVPPAFARIRPEKRDVALQIMNKSQQPRPAIGEDGAW